MKTCTRCVMDTTAKEITFNADGVCNYCTEYDRHMVQIEKNIESSDSYLAEMAQSLKSEREKKGAKYDAIIGISGGVDSSYVCVLAHKLGLNPLLIHFDNGWNAETAVSNIKKLADKCQFDLHTYVINWPEFRDIQRSFIKAGVLDIEMITDQAILATMLNLSKKFGVKTVLSGNNIATEYGLPKSWSWNKRDYKNLKAIHAKYGEVKLKTYPGISSLRWMMVQKLNLGMTFVEILNHYPYKKFESIRELEEDFGWVYYGGKHYESVFTKFYQAYILPKKFGIDKRKAHYSTLIRNKEMSREDVVAELQKDLYDDKTLRDEKEYVLKKLGFSEDEFDRIMNEPPCPHDHFPTDEHLVQFLIRMKRLVRKIIPIG